MIERFSALSRRLPDALRRKDDFRSPHEVIKRSTQQAHTLLTKYGFALDPRSSIAQFFDISIQEILVSRDPVTQQYWPTEISDVYQRKRADLVYKRSVAKQDAQDIQLLAKEFVGYVERHPYAAPDDVNIAEFREDYKSLEDLYQITLSEKINHALKTKKRHLALTTAGMLVAAGAIGTIWPQANQRGSSEGPSQPAYTTQDASQNTYITTQDTHTHVMHPTTNQTVNIAQSLLLQPSFANSSSSFITRAHQDGYDVSEFHWLPRPRQKLIGPNGLMQLAFPMQNDKIHPPLGFIPSNKSVMYPVYIVLTQRQTGNEFIYGMAQNPILITTPKYPGLNPLYAAPNAIIGPDAVTNVQPWYFPLEKQDVLGENTATIKPSLLPSSRK